MPHVVKPVGDLRHFEWLCVSLGFPKTLQQILAGLAHPSGHLDKGQDLLLQVTIAQQAVHRLYEDVDTLVAELIASRCRYDDRIIVQILAQQGIGHLQHTLACCLAFLIKGSSLGHKTVVETIWQDHIHGFVEQFHTLIGCDIAHRREAVNIPGCLLLYGVLRLHIQLLGHLVTIISKQIVVEGLLISCY